MSNRKTTPHTLRREVQIGFRSRIGGHGVWVPRLPDGFGGNFYNMLTTSENNYAKHVACAVLIAYAARYRLEGDMARGRNAIRGARHLRRIL